MILPKPMLKLLPETYFDPSEPGVLRILSIKEWRDIGITQSMGWEHYEVHAPEPHILLFRREKDFLEKVSRITVVTALTCGMSAWGLAIAGSQWIAYGREEATDVKRRAQAETGS